MAARGDHGRHRLAIFGADGRRMNDVVRSTTLPAPLREQLAEMITDTLTVQ